ncbi:uncharacterized protein B0T15DRAFT_543478 [Chaetomium strumarium]|uniref:DSBA-like thioredoxin domain-containing protein n=1 Tax=Chaetomium strumarium TaxID=1170767 RepID=A0AAJ0LYQ1_9PEZI|nr:hypothetical protein B0T15DRAFT_543478 [Chaetomium strumarium]
MELFGDYFEGTGDITSYDTLVRVGVRAGIDGEEVRARLESGKGGAEVDAQVGDAKSKGIRGVPHTTPFKAGARWMGRRILSTLSRFLPRSRREIDLGSRFR